MIWLLYIVVYSYCFRVVRNSITHQYKIKTDLVIDLTKYLFYNFLEVDLVFLKNGLRHEIEMHN